LLKSFIMYVYNKMTPKRNDLYNTKEELVKNITRRGLLDNRYANKIYQGGMMNLRNFNAIQKESISNIARISSVKVTRKEVREMSDPKLKRFLEKLPKNDLLKMKREMTNTALNHNATYFRNTEKVTGKVEQMKKRFINEKKKIAIIVGLRKAAGGRSNLVNAYSKYLKSNK